MKTMIINGKSVQVRATDTKTISTENHMAIFARLASITNMHGTPGQRKGHSK
jgi:hypothetical protein